MRGYDPDKLRSFFSLKGKAGRQAELKGSELHACCPFPHYKPDRGRYYESNPSFAINILSGKYNCFSCGQKGVSIDDLAWELGLGLPDIERKFVVKEETKEIPEIPQRYKKLLSYNRDHAIKILERRKISPETIDLFGIGSNADGTKIYIPLTDKNGKLLGWQERDFAGENRWFTEPYGFKKSEYIFGIEHALDDVVVVESTTDVLRLYSMGYTAVGTMGAMVSKKQMELIADSFNIITLVKQNDSAGEKWFFDMRNFLSERMNVYYYHLPTIYNDICDSPESIINKIKTDRRYLKPFRRITK